MATSRKSPTKARASKAGKALSTSSSSKAKSSAARTLAKRSVAVRKVHNAPKKGTVTRSVAKSAVRKATSSSGKKK